MYPQLRFEPILLSDWSFIDRLSDKTLIVYQMVMNLNLAKSHIVIDKNEFPTIKQIRTSLIELSSMGLISIERGTIL